MRGRAAENNPVRRILVVDDDPAVRDLVTDVLELEGYDVRAVEDGVAALDALREERPAAVVLDAMMPGMDGFSVLAHIRDGADSRELPVIMLTAAADDGSAWRAWTGGVDYFLAKPFKAEELLHFLGYLFGEIEVL